MLLQRYSWIYLTIVFSLSFFLLDEFFVYVLHNLIDSNELLYHRTALFIIVSGFICWSQYSLSELVKLNKSLELSARLATLGEMSSMVAHELISPLHAINLEAELHMLESENDELREFSRRISNKIERAVTIIDSLRSFGKGPINSVKEDHSINAVIENALQLTRPYIGFINITSELANDVPDVKINPVQIEQVLSNLLINAKDAIEEFGQGEIKVLSSYLENRVEVTVVNTGPTIDKKHLPRLFDPFFTTKAEDKGTGLGLAICKKIVDAHDALIQVESEHGETSFKLSFPAANPLSS